MRGELEKVAIEYGPCALDCMTGGTMVRGIVDTNLGGTANFPEYTAGLQGTMTGTITGTHTYGTWTLVVQALNLTYHGEWSAEKTDRQK